MKALALDSHDAIKHGIIWEVKEEVYQMLSQWDFFDDICFDENSDEFDDYVKHLYD